VEVNGRPVSDIRDVVEGLAQPQNGFHLLRLAPDSGRELVVLDAATMDQATAEVMETYRVPEAVRLPQVPLPEGGGDCPGVSSSDHRHPGEAPSGAFPLGPCRSLREAPLRVLRRRARMEQRAVIARVPGQIALRSGRGTSDVAQSQHGLTCVGRKN